MSEILTGTSNGTLNKSEKQNDVLKLFWVLVLLFFIAIGFAAHAVTAPNEPILLSAPNLHGKNFFTVLINSPDPKEAPKNFRAMTTADTIQASASAVLSKGQYEFLISKLNSDSVPGTPGEAKKIHVIDTSTHPHGFVNNMQVIWLDQSSLDQERALLDGLKKTKRVSVYTVPATANNFALNLDDVLKIGGNKIQIQADSVETEPVYLRTKKISYSRLPVVADDISKFDEKHVDQLAKIVKQAKKDEWLHFHNEEGTQDFGILLADVLKNAPTTSLEDILKRQNELGAQAKLDPIATSPQLEKIYAYAKEQSPDFKTLYSYWTKAH